MKRRNLFCWIILPALILPVQCTYHDRPVRYPLPGHDLVFSSPANVWDEGIPLGNGLLGAMVWEKEGRLRIALDRSDLWDLRPMKGLEGKEFRFGWVVQQVLDSNYREVQERFDAPYDRVAGPTKIPGGALEFETAGLGKVKEVRLHLRKALCEVVWESGVRMQCFVHATEPAGWFRFENLADTLVPVLVMPPYRGNESMPESSLQRLEYPPAGLIHTPRSVTATQEGWGGFVYQVHVAWEQPDQGILEGVWGIDASLPGDEKKPDAAGLVVAARERGFETDLKTHRRWWREYWDRSSVVLPDKVLERQWYLEQYKFGSASRRGAPPIPLMGVWTADNNELPPWKGDYHHDLNTQMCYWPCYSGNHPEEGQAFTDWLWEVKETAERYTRTYFRTGGLNMPGVTTLQGEPMGGWIQYSLSPTIGAWLAQHFYLHWRYSMDTVFLRERAYPYITAVARHFDGLSVKEGGNFRRLPLSSSPEIHDNSIHAWFRQTTGFDLALIRWTYEKSAEMAEVLGKREEAMKYRTTLSEWPGFAVSAEDGGLPVAPGEPLRQSHRHFSHLLGIHPLGLIDPDHGEEEKKIVEASLKRLESLGSDTWNGYSYSWLGCLQARAGNGEKAAEALRIFAECFCLPNSLHANGDLSGTGKSLNTGRVFTLEGNMAFAAGIQEMLIRSHTGTVELFPAVPGDWNDLSFKQLRAEGAFLVSAGKKEGTVQWVEVESERGGELNLLDPFNQAGFTSTKEPHWMTVNGKRILRFPMKAGEKVRLEKR